MSDLFTRVGRRALLVKMLEQERLGSNQAPQIARRPAHDPGPISFAQWRLWLLDQIEPGDHTYNMPATIRLQGRLDTGALARTFAHLAQRHESLRTTFAQAEGHPHVVIAPPGDVALPLIDLQALPPAEREVRARQVAEEEARRSFDLTRGPLLRLTLVRLEPEAHLLIIVMHHIIADGWSIGVMMREFALLYADQAGEGGQTSPLPALPLQYGDYAAWQQQWLRGTALQQQLDYWKRQLANPPTLELPADRPRPAVRSNRGARWRQAISLELAESLRALSREQGATLFMTLLAAFQVLLWRYSGQEDLLVGSPISGRSRPELEGIIGFFVNNLVLRGDLAGNPTFCELLVRVKQTTTEAYAHQELPFEQLVEALQPERSLSRTPLFGVMFALQHVRLQPMQLPGLQALPQAIDTGTAKFDLLLEMTEEADGLSAVWEYSVDLFDGWRIEAMAGHFCQLLTAIAAGPDRRIADLPLLTAAESERALLAWNDTAAPPPTARCVHERFEAQAEQSPDAPALVCGDVQLTYSELNRRANRLAHYLRERGVGPEVVVAVCMERSTEMIISLLAIMKAGGAYLPLDPSYPQERLQYMCADAGAQILLTSEMLAANGDAIGGRCEQNPANAAFAANSAYVIYTSGSTGRPKGVQLAHSGLLHLIDWHQRRYCLTAQDRTTHLAGVGFDASVWEIWPTLTAGACLHLPTSEILLEPEALRDWLVAERITVSFVPTPVAEALLALPWPSDVALRALLTGGDRLRSFVPPTLAFVVVNHYGPTENTVVATAAAVPSARTGQPPAPSIGGPIDNVQVYILDSRMQPVPVGVSGELYISGAQLARGYLGQPALTAARFVPNPFGVHGGERLYRTGDLVRYLPSGHIDFIGRADHQVKIRGFRIELGEIEATLVQHPAVAEAVVLLRARAEGGTADLVAYIVPAAQIEVPALRAFLAERLPGYMVPSAFVLLERLPVTPNGKIDRQALPAPELHREGPGYVAPQSMVEEVLCSIWAETLGLQRVGVYDHFFELGGHSLLATQALSRLRKWLGVELPLRSLFEAPTVAAIAPQVERLLRAGDGAPAVDEAPIERMARAAALPLSFAQQRLWFLDRLQPGNPAYNIPVAVRLQGRLDAAALARSLEAIIWRHESLRTTFGMVGERALQTIATDVQFTMPIVDLTTLAEPEQEAQAMALALREANRPFDLSRDLMMRATLLQLGEQEHLLLLTMHHIAFDGWSLGVLVREVVALYEAFLAGNTSSLPELPIQYADFACWQRNWLQGEVLHKQLSYWKERLAHLTLLELPTDRPRPVRQSSQGATLPVSISAELTRGLKSLSRQEGVTLYMTLLAAFAALLQLYTGQDDISVGTPIANRNRVETEGMIGFFVNTLVMRCDLSGEPSFLELLARVRETALGAYRHQDLPFDMLVDALQLERSLSHHPLYQVMFILQNAPMGVLQLPGLRLTPVAVGGDSTKCDLTLMLIEEGEELSGRLTYSTDLFDEERMLQMIEHFQTFLEGVVREWAGGGADESI